MLIDYFFLPNVCFKPLIVCFKPLIVYFKHLQCFLHCKRLRDSILSPFFHSYIFAMYKNEALWI